MININHLNFKNEVLECNIPVLVDFYSETCMPCRQLMPVLEEIASEYKDKIKIVKADIADNWNLTEEYNIMVSPTLIFFKNGNETDRVRGLVNKSFLSKKIDNIVQ